MEQSCPHIAQIGAYRDGELPAMRHAEIERHLQDCAACRDELADLERLRALARTFAPPTISPQAIERLHDRVDSLTDLSLRRLAEALSGLAAVLLVGATLLIGRAPQTSAQPLPPWDSAIASVRTSTAPGSERIHTAEWIVSELASDEASDHD